MEKPVFEKKVSEFEDKVIEINRISRTVKGGRRIRFRALVLVGNRKGKVGFGVSKASEVVQAIAKAKDHAQKHMIEVPISKETIPHQVNSSFGSATILLKPAPVGSSIIAGGAIRNLLELAGLKNVVAKSMGSNNKINMVTAAFKALSDLRTEKSIVDEAVEIKKTEDVPAKEEKPVEEKVKKAEKKPAKKTVKAKKE